MDPKKVLEGFNRRIAAGSRVSYYPMVVKGAQGCVITDTSGKEYLDFNANWTAAGLGYANSIVIAAVKEALDSGFGSSSLTFPSEEALELAELLCEITPGEFEKKVWFGHSGSDACGAAYKLLPMSTRRQRVLSFHGGMHGTDLAGIAMGGHPSTAKYSVPSLVTKVPYAYCYRCPFGLEYPSCGVYCASDYIEDQVFKYATDPGDISFMIVEAMQSDSGDVIPPEEYLKKLKATCEKFGILYVADEVKIAPSRTGRLFGVNNYGVVPDAVTMGKSLGSGLPIGAMIGREEFMDGPYLGLTLLGNLIVVAAGLASLKLLTQQRMLEQVLKLGEQLRKRMEEIKEKHSLVGDVRGKGLFVGIELVKDRKSKQPATLETAKVVFRAWQLGLITVYVGVDRNVIELTPPLVITEEEIEKGARILDQALTDVEKGLVSDEEVKGYGGF